MTTGSQLIADLKSMLLEIDPKLPHDLNETDHFYNDLHMDSLDLTEYVATIEQKFQIRISDEIWEELSSIKAIVEFLDVHIAA